MVVEQAPGIEDTAAALEHLAQTVHKTAAVDIVAKDSASLDAASDDVVHGPWMIESWLPRHRIRLEARGLAVKYSLLAPRIG